MQNYALLCMKEWHYFILHLLFPLSCLTGITVLLSLTVFMLLVAEIMPATSDSVPLIGKLRASFKLEIELNLMKDYFFVDVVLDSILPI